MCGSSNRNAGHAPRRAAARNKGAAAAAGEVLIFLDAHVDVTHGWAEPLIAAVRDPAVGAAARRVLYSTMGLRVMIEAGL